MIVIIRKGRLIALWDFGSFKKQLRNFNCLVSTTQRRAADMSAIAADTLQADTRLIAYNRVLQGELKNAKRSLSIADKQLKGRKAEMTAQGKKS